MKKLISLISTEGKTMEQVQKEAVTAFQKYQKAQEKFNRQSEEKGMLAPEPSKDNIQIISFREKPSYPKKYLYSILSEIKKRIKKN